MKGRRTNQLFEYVCSFARVTGPTCRERNRLRGSDSRSLASKLRRLCLTVCCLDAAGFPGVLHSPSDRKKSQGPRTFHRQPIEVGKKQLSQSKSPCSLGRKKSIVGALRCPWQKFQNGPVVPLALCTREKTR
jgi:hypothetical protein